MCTPTRTLDDCIESAKAGVTATIAGGANHLRRYRADDLVGAAIHEAADHAVPALSHNLLAVFGSADHLWFESPPSGSAMGEHGIMGAISRVVYTGISEAVWEWAYALEGDTLVCEAPDCESTDDHNLCPNTDHCVACLDNDVRCTSCCGGAGTCERCAVALIEEAKRS